MKHELHVPSIIQAGDTRAIRNGAPNQLAYAGGIKISFRMAGSARNGR